VEAWFWPRVVTAWHAAALMAKRKSGLIVELVEQPNVGYHGAFYFDVMQTLLKRMTFGLSTAHPETTDTFADHGCVVLMIWV
jgi:hypothetical protein